MRYGRVRAAANANARSEDGVLDVHCQERLCPGEMDTPECQDEVFLVYEPSSTQLFSSSEPPDQRICC